jgi:two-component SAPR family response regulator
MSWSVRTPSGVIYQREFEAAMQDFAQKKGWMVTGMYNESTLVDEQLLNALMLYPFVWEGGKAKKNPYYTPASLLIAGNRRLQYRYWLQQHFPTTFEEIEQVASRQKPSEPEGLQVRESYNLESPALLNSEQTEEGKWKIRCLGELRIFRKNGDQIDWKVAGGSTRKLKTLFAYLMHKGDRGATVEELADLLWPYSEDLQDSTNRLYHAIGFLRKVLSVDGKGGRSSPFVIKRDQRYYLAVPKDSWIDLPLFKELCFKGNRHLGNKQLDEALVCYESADRLYKGDLLSDIPQKYVDNVEKDWCWSRRYWFRDMYLKLLYGLGSIHFQQQAFSKAMIYCDRLLKEEPTSESGHRLKMRVLHASGRMDALHRQYRLYTKMLQKFEMGKPSQTMRNLYDELTNFSEKS